jgi:hypothetical protein
MATTRSASRAGRIARAERIRSSATCSIDPGPVPGKGRSRCPGRRSHIGCPRFVVWLSHGLRGPGTAGRERLKRGLLSSK